MEFKISLDWGKKKSIVTPTTIPQTWGNSIFYPINNTTQSGEALISMFNDLPEIQAPVNYAIDSLSIIPFSHYRNDKEIQNSKVLKLLQNPNQYQTELDFTKMFFLNRIMLGLGYINRVKPTGFTATKQLYVLPTQSTEPVLEEKNLKDLRLNKIVGYTTNFGLGEISLDESEVFVQRETSLIDNNYYDARSRLMSAILTSDSLRNNYEARIKLISDRGAVAIVSPSGQDETIDPDAATDMQNSFYNKFGLKGDKQPVAVLPRGVNVNQIGMNATELELLPSKEKDFSIVCNVLGIDPALFGIGNNTYNNKKLAKTSFYEDTIIPYFNNYLALLTKVFELPENESLVPDYSQIAAMQEDYEKIVNANSKLWNDGAITEKEYREATGYEGGEEKKKSELSKDDTNQNE